MVNPYKIGVVGYSPVIRTVICEYLTRAVEIAESLVNTHFFYPTHCLSLFVERHGNILISRLIVVRKVVKKTVKKTRIYAEYQNNPCINR